MPVEVEREPLTAPSDFTSLSYRMRSLLALRSGFAIVAIAVGIFWPPVPPHLRPGLVSSSAIYVALEGAGELLRQGGRRRRLVVLGLGVVLDGVYLTWITFQSGGALSPLQALLFVHVVAISLLASYRTGLKVAVWDSLLLLSFAYAESSGVLPAPRGLGSLGRIAATTPSQILAITLLTLWGVTVATATLSAVNERNLRRKRADLEALARMVAEMGERRSAEEIPNALIESLRATFDVRRGLVLASREGDLSLLASCGIESTASPAPGMDRVVERALSSRTVQLIRELDPTQDPRLSAILPGSRNILIVPLFLAGGFRLGVLVAERNTQSDRIDGWTVAIIQEFASQTAVSLHNAWLLEDNREKLAENRRLREELVAQNLTLEARVIERTEELRDSLDRLHGSNAERHRLLSHLVRAQEDERRRIAGDIHDDPLQLLVVVTMRLDFLRRELADPAHAEQASELREMVRGAIAKLRTLMFELRPPILEEQGLAAALQDHAEQWNLDQEIVIHDRFDAEPPDETRLILYRIAQEALANVRKHSRADRVVVTMNEHEGSFHVRIEDDGVGFSSGAVAGGRHGHIGLTSMRERAELAGGGCRIESLPGGGTTVEFWVPTSAEAPAPATLRGSLADQR
jgi:signal transduction histidine kinase